MSTKIKHKTKSQLKNLLSLDPNLKRDVSNEVKTISDQDRLNLIKILLAIHRNKLNPQLKKLVSLDPIVKRDVLNEVKTISDQDRLNLIRNEFI